MAVLLAVSVNAAVRYHWLAEPPSFLYEILIFLAFATGVIFVRLYRVARPGVFVWMYLLTLALKILIYAGFNLVIILHDPPGAKANVAFFMVTYLLFTGLEIASLYRFISTSGRP